MTKMIQVVLFLVLVFANNKISKSVGHVSICITKRSINIFEISAAYWPVIKKVRYGLGAIFKHILYVLYYV